MSKHELIDMARGTPTEPDVFDLVRSFRSQGRPFCLATVVRTADLTSAKAGAKAVITADGEILGHLGGGCIRKAVTRAAAESLESGQARMISVRPTGRDSDAAPDIEIMPNGCPSGGTVDLFVEPYKVAPSLWIMGETPIARAIQAHAALMGLRVRFGPVEAGEDAPDPDFVVIASQGAGDADALRTALATGAGYVTMIASHRKADFLKSKLIGEGYGEADVARVISPAGLDLGAIDPHEIAISVLGHLVAWRRSQGAGKG